MPASRRRARLVDVLDPAGFDDAGLVGELGSVADLRAQLAAYEAGLVAELAARRPAQSDLAEGEPGAGVEGWLPDRAPVGVSEFLADELALVTRSSRAAAVTLAERSVALVHELPATWGALADGLVDLSRANAIVRALAGQSTAAGGPVDPGVIAEVEAQALGWAVAGESPRRLQERVAAALIAVDEGAADRRRKRAERLADVTVRSLPDGLAQLVAELPAPMAAACRETVDVYARMLKDDGDARPIGQLRALVLTDLVLRPWDVSRPPVTAQVTVLAPLPVFRNGPDPAGGPAPVRADAAVPTDADAASVDGAPITGGQLRELLGQLDALCSGGLQAPAGGILDIALTDPLTGALRATVTRGELARRARRGCPRHAPGAGCSCPVLDRPPRVDRYTPTPAQRRYVRARDRTCRHPGCRRPAARTDLDHVVPHGAGGPTDCANLCCLCRRHHRLKTHAPGWRFTMTPDGILSVTTPSGVTRTTRPPGHRLPDDLVLIRTGGPPAADDDPPPF
ncbi:HNH endonuclease signature motif containing protein [Modestobacter lapidis]